MIPSTGHFIWFGKELPFLYMVGIRSAIEKGGFDRVVLHCEKELVGSAGWEYLDGRRGLEIREVSPSAFEKLPGGLGSGVRELFGRLKKPAARANVMRAAILAIEGGVYLDTDTITLSSLDSLRKGASVFCGKEVIAMPGTMRRDFSLRTTLRTGALLALRDGYRRVPAGWRSFRNVEGLFSEAVNNAVFATEPGHDFVLTLLERMISMTPTRQRVRFALGTHLLQEQVSSYSGDDLVVHEPGVFYPIGPEVSQHWFKPGSAAHVGEMLRPETKIVHWYASVRTKEYLPEWTQRRMSDLRKDVALCRLAVPYLDL